MDDSISSGSDVKKSRSSEEAAGIIEQEQDSEIHMSLCLSALHTLEPADYAEMKEIFDKFKVPYDKMCEMPKEVISDPNLVVQIERNFYTWENGAPMIMAYLVFKQPLPPDSIGASLNE